MRQIAIAFTTTGPSPKQGHRISELLAVEDVDGEARRTYFLAFKPEILGERPTFLERLDALDELVGDAPIVVHNAAQWRKYLRVELRQLKKRGARRLLRQTVDVYRWAYQRHPKRRKDIAAIARRVGITPSSELSGLRRD